MTDAREDSRQRTSQLYQAYGLKGLFAEEFDLEDVRLRFRNKYGREPELIKITAGGELWSFVLYEEIEFEFGKPFDFTVQCVPPFPI